MESNPEVDYKELLRKYINNVWYEGARQIVERNRTYFEEFTEVEWRVLKYLAEHEDEAP